jgi:hypothetical protein
LTDTECDVSKNRNLLVAGDKSIAIWINPVRARIGGIDGPFIQEFKWTELAEAGVCFKLVGQWEEAGELFGTQSWVTADSG